MLRTTLNVPLTAIAVLGVALQFVPYRVKNPPVRQEPDWNAAETRALAERACFDCHSNQVKVPWYGHIAPVAWVVRNHVDEGRTQLNFSEMDRPQKEAEEAGEVVNEGEMPPAYYLALHPEARLSSEERRRLAAGLYATLGGEHEGDDEDERHDD